MTPQALFHDDFRDALRYSIKALGGFEAVGADLWPSKLRKQAGAWLSDCLNPERAAKLDIEEIEEIVRMARAAGIHAAMNQFADDTGYSHPELAPQLSDEQKIAEEMRQLTARFTHLADQLAANSAEKVTRLRSAR